MGKEHDTFPLGDEVEEWLKQRDRGQHIAREPDMSETARYRHGRRLIREFMRAFHRFPSTADARKRQADYNVGKSFVDRDRLTRVSLEGNRYAFGYFKTDDSEVLQMRRRALIGAEVSIGEEMVREREGAIVGASPGMMGIWTPKRNYWERELDICVSKARVGFQTFLFATISYFGPDIYYIEDNGNKRPLENKPSVVQRAYSELSDLTQLQTHSS